MIVLGLLVLFAAGGLAVFGITTRDSAHSLLVLACWTTTCLAREPAVLLRTRPARSSNHGSRLHRAPVLVIGYDDESCPDCSSPSGRRWLDVGVGRAALAPTQVASLLFRQDPLGVLVPAGHRFAGLEGVPVADLAEEPLLLAEEVRAPEFNQFTVEMCRSVGFTPTVYGGTVESIRAAADLVAQGRCLYCVPSSCISALPGTTWRPLTEPASYYPWSVLWRAADDSGHVRAVVSCAQVMSKRLGWLAAAVGQAAL